MKHGSASRLMPLFVLAIVALGLSGCEKKGSLRGSNGADSTGKRGKISSGEAAKPGTVYKRLAAEYLRKRQLTQALQNAKKAVAVDSRDGDAHGILALVYQALRENDRAEEHFKRAVRIDPQDSYNLNAYGGFLCNLRRYKDARPMFLSALKNPLYRTPWIPLTNAGLCEIRSGQIDEGEKFLRRALQRNRKFAPALLEMASISMTQSKPLSARAYLQRYHEVAKPNPLSLWLAVRSERALGDNAKATRYGMLLRARFPDSDQAAALSRPQPPAAPKSQ